MHACIQYSRVCACVIIVLLIFAQSFYLSEHFQFRLMNYMEYLPMDFDTLFVLLLTTVRCIRHRVDEIPVRETQVDR